VSLVSREEATPVVEIRDDAPSPEAVHTVASQRPMAGSEDDRR
jgi:hypothetical protein